MLAIEGFPEKWPSISDSAKDGVITNSHDCKAGSLIFDLQCLKYTVVIPKNITQRIVVAD